MILKMAAEWAVSELALKSVNMKTRSVVRKRSVLFTRVL